MPPSVRHSAKDAKASATTAERTTREQGSHDGQRWSRHIRSGGIHALVLRKAAELRVVSRRRHIENSRIADGQRHHLGSQGPILLSRRKPGYLTPRRPKRGYRCTNSSIH